MIGRLTGVLLEKNPPSMLIDVQGVGYEVDAPMSTFYALPLRLEFGLIARQGRVIPQKALHQHQALPLCPAVR